MISSTTSLQFGADDGQSQEIAARQACSAVAGIEEKSVEYMSIGKIDRD